jgi:hypothetical protein
MKISIFYINSYVLLVITIVSYKRQKLQRKYNIYWTESLYDK